MVTIEDVSKWWDERPCNVGHSTATDALIYSREVTAEKYLREPHIPAFLDAEEWRGKRVLEVGCGIGTAVIDLARADAYVVGIDVSRESLAIAMERLVAEHLDHKVILLNVNVEERTGVATPIDLIYSFGVLHHIPHPAVALRNLLSAADERTELRIMLYHRWSLKGIRLGLTDKRIARGSEARSGCPITRAYSRRSARKLLEENGWHVEHVHVDHILRFSVRHLKKGEHVPTLLYRCLPRRAYHFLEQHLGWHLLIVATPATVQ